jgi:hypothetical protein
MSKRFYLCNLIPLWNIDDEALDADWGVETAGDGDFVELRIEVTEGPLDPEAENFFVSFEIYEDDFLLSGFRDDLTAHIASPTAEAEEETEVRPVRIHPADRAVPVAERDKAIWVSPGEKTGLIRCYWKAERIDDVSGDPEYYFDVVVGLNGREAKERATRILTVTAAGLPVLVADIGLTAGTAAVVTAAGWTRSRVTVDTAEVGMVARIVGGQPGMTLRFQILDTQTHSEVIEQIDVPVGTGPIVRTTWRPRRPLPEDAWGPLKFRAFFEEVSGRITTSAAHASGAVTVEELFATVRPEAPLELMLVDEDGRPLANQAYILRDEDGKVLVSSKTGPGGAILWSGADERQVTVELPGLIALDATEDEGPAPEDTAAGTVFTLFDVRPGAVPE